ncbi:MAG TPA: TolC family protein [Bacteroidales bacterium]|nr:TolC family protein [Bacteroidales bacterium]HOK99645.1 TolC family protein [Bacteroidales bacterium]
MKCFRCLVTSFACLFLGTFYLNGQRLWTLEECIAYAYQNNLTIKRQMLQTEIAKNNYQQSYYDLLPDLGAGASHNIGKGRVADYTSFSYSNEVNAGSMGLRSNVVVSSGFQKINTIRAQKYAFLSAKEQLERTKNSVALAIASAYLQILFDREYYEITKSQAEITKQQLDRTRKLYEVGNVARGSLLEMEASYAAELVSVTNAKNKLDLSYLSLAQMLDLDTVRNFAVAIPEVVVPDTFTENPDSIFLLAVETMPEIKSARYALEKSKSQLSMARGSRLPQLSLTADYYTQYNLKAERPIDPQNPLITEKYPIADQLNDKLYKQLSLNLSIPIFMRYQIQTNISNAKIGQLDAEYQLRQTILDLRKEIEQAYADALASFESYRSRQEALKSQEENFKYVQQKYEVGLISAIDYNIAKNNYLKAQSDLLQAKYQFVFNMKVLDFYKGKRLSL